MTATDATLKILDLARWAPSGDNTQPWRFQVLAPDHVVVYGFDTRDHCLYDLDGQASQVSLGALLETMRIAGTTVGYRVSAQRRLDSPDTRPVFDVALSADPAVAPDPLGGVIERRSVQRRPLSTRALRAEEKQALEASVSAANRVLWFDGFQARLRVARLLFANAKLRLTLRETFEIHRSVIQWGARFSTDRIPDEAVGLDPVATRLMRWAMVDWRRVAFLNRYLGGTILPRVQLDLMPALACAAHAVVIAPATPRSIDDFVAAGRAIQRFWLTATKLGLQHQPSYTPLVFAAYARQGRRFSAETRAPEAAKWIKSALDTLVGDPVAAERVIWMGRLGAGRPAKARSLRLSLQTLLQPPSNRA